MDRRSLSIKQRKVGARKKCLLKGWSIDRQGERERSWWGVGGGEGRKKNVPACGHCFLPSV